MLTTLGVDIRHAIAASIVAVIATSCGAASSYVRDGLANIRIGIFLCVATTTGALFGAALNGVLPVRVLFLIFAAVLVSVALPWILLQERLLRPLQLAVVVPVRRLPHPGPLSVP